MSWKGVAAGAVAGWLLGHGSWLSVIFCSVLGHDLEERWRRSRARRGASSRRGTGGCQPPVSDDRLSQAYAMLGVSANDDAETLRRAYRELAKMCHPDTLRAQGLSEEAIGRATERMKAINAAWATIKSARGI